ncbi:hypothetical protein V5O48_010010 [Marasmius crinis-equi]|uniref:Uncharacterized protein n=1 Tax=Marasmius crinis-equi TaxID=585013 RepID=A0ABR3F9L9_9AGAR
MGQFGVIIRSMFNVKAVFVPNAGCATASIESHIFAAMYSYTMGVDFIVMILTAYRTFLNRKYSESGLVKLLFRDGLAYFAVAFVMNLIAVVFSLLNLNPVMALIAEYGLSSPNLVPATTFATIAACRVVRRLNTYMHSGPQIFTTSWAAKSTTQPVSTATIPVGSRTAADLRVEMATFTNGEADKDYAMERTDVEGRRSRRDSEELFKHPRAI